MLGCCISGFAIITRNNPKKFAETLHHMQGLATCQFLGARFSHVTFSDYGGPSISNGDPGLPRTWDPLMVSYGNSMGPKGSQPLGSLKIPLIYRGLYYVPSSIEIILRIKDPYQLMNQPAYNETQQIPAHLLRMVSWNLNTLLFGGVRSHPFIIRRKVSQDSWGWHLRSF